MRKLALSLAVLALVTSPALAKPGKYNKVVSVGEKAPDFSGIPAVMGDKDTSLSLDAIKDKVVVLVFFANHCPAVTTIEDRVIDFANDYKDKGVKVVAVAVSDADEDKIPGIKARIKDKGYPFVYGYDFSQEIGRNYGASNTPQFFVLDQGRVIRYTGAFDDNVMKASKASKSYLKDAVDAVLAGKEVETTETKAQGCGIHYNSK